MLRGQRTLGRPSTTLAVALLVWLLFPGTEGNQRGSLDVYVACPAFLAKTDLQKLSVVSIVDAGEWRSRPGKQSRSLRTNSLTDLGTGRNSPWRCQRLDSRVAALSTGTKRAPSAHTHPVQDVWKERRNLPIASGEKPQGHRHATAQMGRPHKEPDDSQELLQNTAASHVVPTEHSVMNSAQTVAVTVKRQKKTRRQKTGKREEGRRSSRIPVRDTGMASELEPKGPKKERGKKKGSTPDEKVADETEEEAAPRIKRRKTNSSGKTSSKQVPTEEPIAEDDPLFLKHRALAQKSRKFLGAHISAAGGAQFAPLNCLAIAGKLEKPRSLPNSKGRTYVGVLVTGSCCGVDCCSSKRPGKIWNHIPGWLDYAAVTPLLLVPLCGGMH